MPGRDRTGPRGVGPMTGWAMGLCGRDPRPEEAEGPIRGGRRSGFAGNRRGRGRAGYGRAGGRTGGWGRGWGAEWQGGRAAGWSPGWGAGRGAGWGAGRGAGRGAGWGAGRGAGWAAAGWGSGRESPPALVDPLPGTGREETGTRRPAPDPGSERRALVERANALRSELDAVQRRLDVEGSGAKEIEE